MKLPSRDPIPVHVDRRASANLGAGKDRLDKDISRAPVIDLNAGDHSTSIMENVLSTSSQQEPLALAGPLRCTASQL